MSDITIDTSYLYATLQESLSPEDAERETLNLAAISLSKDIDTKMNDIPDVKQMIGTIVRMGGGELTFYPDDLDRTGVVQFEFERVNGLIAITVRAQEREDDHE